MPSSRSVLTCRPAFPGGRLLGVPLPSVPWLTRDSKGSLRAAFNSLSAAALGAPSGPAGFSTAFTGGSLAPFFRADFVAGFAAGFPGALTAGFAAASDAAGFAAAAGFVAAGAGLTGPWAAGFADACAAGFAGVCVAGLTGVCAAGFAGVCVAGLAGGLVACCVLCPACSAVEFPIPGGSGFLCARKLGAAVPIKSPNPMVIAERIVRSFPLRVFQARRPAWLPLRQPQSSRQAW